jgi:hypothetical protein
MAATRDAIASFKATAELPSYQGVWMPAVAWKEAIRRETSKVLSDQLVSKAISKLYIDFGATIVSLSGVQLKVFTHKYTVKKAGVKRGQLVTFWIVQSSACVDPTIKKTDASFWQKRYDRHAQRFQPRPETRGRKRQRDDHPIKEVDLTQDQVKDNLKMVDELQALMKQRHDATVSEQQKEFDNQSSIAMRPPPLHEQDFQQWVREKWLEDFPNLPFPENFQALPIPPAEPEKKIGRYVLNDLKLPSGHVIKDLPGNYFCVDAGQYGRLKQASRIVKAFSNHLCYERNQSSKLSKTMNAAVTSAFPTVPTTAQEIIIAFSRYTFLLDVQAQLEPSHKNDMDSFLDLQKILNSSPSARTLDDAVDDLATDQAMLASFEIQRADSVFLQSDKAPDGSEAMLLVWWRKEDTRKTPFGSIRQFKAGLAATGKKAADIAEGIEATVSAYRSL